MSRADVASRRPSGGNARRSSSGSSRDAFSQDAARVEASLSYIAPAMEGSWFPSGFYGHHRSSYRGDIDFQHTVRQAAQPRPPKNLEKKLLVKMRSHPFSHHDNKHTFCNKGEYLGGETGKKKVAGRSGTFTADFLHFRSNPGNELYHTRRIRSATVAGLKTAGELGQDSAKNWTLDGERSQTSYGRTRHATAPARLFGPPPPQPLDSQLRSCYQLSYREHRPESLFPMIPPADYGVSRPSTSNRSAAEAAPFQASPTSPSPPSLPPVTPKLMTMTSQPTSPVLSPTASRPSTRGPTPTLNTQASLPLSHAQSVNVSPLPTPSC